MQILITGASGFIGKPLVEKLLLSGHAVQVVTRDTNKHFPDGVKVINADLTDSNCELTNSLSTCDVILNCAGEIHTETKMHALHVEGTKKLLDALKISAGNTEKPKHWVQLSSVGAYGPPNAAGQSRIITESSPHNPKGEYEITKTLADQLLIDAAKESNITFSILRPSNVIGPCMLNQSFFGLLNSIKDRNFFYIGSKKSITTYIHVDDVVDVLILCTHDMRAKNQVFNLSNDCGLAEIVAKVSRVFGREDRCLCLPETLLRFIVCTLSSIVSLPLTKRRIDFLVAKTTYPSTKILELLDFKPSRSILDFASSHLITSK
jgi:nucleoside-diphosphate-sugar epimerase